MISTEVVCLLFSFFRRSCTGDSLALKEPPPGDGRTHLSPMGDTAALLEMDDPPAVFGAANVEMVALQGSTASTLIALTRGERNGNSDRESW